MELARVLEPGGSLVVGELGRWSPWNVRCRISGLAGHPVWRESRFWSRHGSQAGIGSRSGHLRPVPAGGQITG